MIRVNVFSCACVNRNYLAQKILLDVCVYVAINRLLMYSTRISNHDGQHKKWRLFFINSLKTLVNRAFPMINCMCNKTILTFEKTQDKPASLAVKKSARVSNTKNQVGCLSDARQP